MALAPALIEGMFARRYSHTMMDLLRELEEDPEMVALFEQCHPDFWDDLAEQGYLCLEHDLFPNALAIFQFLLRYMPHEAGYWAASADALAGLKEYMRAAEHYQQTTELAPDIPDAFYYLAENWLILKQHQYAIECLHQVLELTGTQPHPLHQEAQRKLEFAHQALAA